MNQHESQRGFGDSAQGWRFYEHAPGRDVDAVEAWRLVFWNEEEDSALEAEEIAHFAANPSHLADTLAKDLVALQANGLGSVRANWALDTTSQAESRQEGGNQSTTKATNHTKESRINGTRG